MTISIHNITRSDRAIRFTNGTCPRCGKFPANCGWLSRGLLIASVYPERTIPVKYGNWELRDL